MSLENLANLGEFFGGIAVIISLLYLAVQVRQNTTALREAAARQTLDANVRLALVPVEQPGLSELAIRGSQDLDSLDATERLRLHLYWMLIFLHYQDTYHHATRSLIEHDLWVAHETHMIEYLSTPGIREWWNGNKHRFSSNSADFVGGRLSSAN